MLLVTARISEEKRIGVLSDAVSHLPARYVLVVAGPENDAETAAKLRGNDRVIMLGPVDPPGDLLAACDGVLSASRYEGYGLAMAEGILAGKPLIATRTGLLERLEGVARIVSDDATPADWATIIKSVFRDHDNREDRVATGLASIDRIDDFVDAWRSLITDQ